MGEEKTNNENWLPLRKLAPKTKYAMGYLSLMARRGNLKAKKEGKTWHSTLENVKAFEDEMAKRNEKRKKSLSKGYFKRTNGETKPKEKVMDIAPDEIKKEDSDFEDAQGELETVLNGIKEKEGKSGGVDTEVPIPIKNNQEEAKPVMVLNDNAADSVTEKVVSGLESAVDDEKKDEVSIPINQNLDIKSNVTENSSVVSDIQPKNPILNQTQKTIQSKKPKINILKIIGILLILISLALIGVLVYMNM